MYILHKKTKKKQSTCAENPKRANITLPRWWRALFFFFLPLLATRHGYGRIPEHGCTPMALPPRLCFPAPLVFFFMRILFFVFSMPHLGWIACRHKPNAAKKKKDKWTYNG